MPLAFWVNNLPPFLGPHWGNFGIRYYGLSYVLGFLAGAWLLFRYAHAGRSRLPADKVADFMVLLVFGVMLGGRLGSFLFYHPDQLRHDPLSFFRVWEGGMASHGGMIGVAVAIAWFSRSAKIPFLHLSDLVCSVVSAGLLFGRLANFINGELWGTPTRVAWAVIFPKARTRTRRCISSCRATRPSFTRLRWRAPCSWPTCSGASGGVTRWRSAPGNSAGNSSWATRWSASSASSSASRMLALTSSSASAAGHFIHSL